MDGVTISVIGLKLRRSSVRIVPKSIIMVISPPPWTPDLTKITLDENNCICIHCEIMCRSTIQRSESALEIRARDVGVRIMMPGWGVFGPFVTVCNYS